VARIKRADGMAVNPFGAHQADPNVRPLSRVRIHETCEADKLDAMTGDPRMRWGPASGIGAPLATFAVNCKSYSFKVSRVGSDKGNVIGTERFPQATSRTARIHCGELSVRKTAQTG
jgi:hypothetical protein